MYKFKWRGETLDTVEFISNERDEDRKRTNKVLVTTGRNYLGNVKVLKRLDRAPLEYRKLENYSWFEGFYTNGSRFVEGE